MATPRKSVEAIKAVVQGGRAVNVAELAEELISAFGGPRYFSKRFFREFKGARVGSVVRAKMLESVLRVIANSSAQNKDLRKSESDLSDQELAETAFQLLGRLHEPKEDHGGDPQAAAPG